MVSNQVEIIKRMSFCIQDRICRKDRILNNTQNDIQYM